MPDHPTDVDQDVIAPTEDHGPASSPAAGREEPMIRLDGVSKTYPGSSVPAVESLTLDIPRGEVLVLVGPSGCGKSTTLRLINRMIEPTAGRIVFDGRDVTRVNADHLRRSIGYVIQQVGLFPHRTIADNVATVPRMLGWDRARTKARVDELLDMVGLDPTQFRDRFPKELSGGQAQRVGVARALGADPPVLLMDEPFGAIDPITRDRLQNEFLRLQGELKKTIVFVTHDIDEAIKMGDRIAILGDRSRIAQLDTPQRILSLPIDDFVEDFIGSGATLKGLNFERVRDLDLDAAGFPVAGIDVGRARATALLEAAHQQWLLLLDVDERPVRWVDGDDLDRTDRPLTSLGLPVKVTVEPNATLHDTLEAMLTSSIGCAVVTDERGRFRGVVQIEQLTEAIARMRREARAHYRARGARGGNVDPDLPL
ncbi:betaine/proline/choline family ABC transporter ATP-binding protein [Iamia sp. SCSIO 61187]|uniref:betaine/proline/choline family ABC transporter ATP-binding protein n=1 Tax=Iamia sp. SCSIO 61187 TaxID=2722752 RepID=UPI001C633F52|nr:betaine/proline/choline family ABC transporter ATP-binding protein [Iamia sp. SCSIO 61187]QYG91307.1 betaine/proline/choline family ABC transporter ATP-binding protein [Iamia sp. SCSIO 61187]